MILNFFTVLHDLSLTMNDNSVKSTCNKIVDDKIRLFHDEIHRVETKFRRHQELLQRLFREERDHASRTASALEERMMVSINDFEQKTTAALAALRTSPPSSSSSDSESSDNEEDDKLTTTTPSSGPSDKDTELIIKVSKTDKALLEETPSTSSTNDKRSNQSNSSDSKPLTDKPLTPELPRRRRPNSPTRSITFKKGVTYPNRSPPRCNRSSISSRSPSSTQGPTPSKIRKTTENDLRRQLDHMRTENKKLRERSKSKRH